MPVPALLGIAPFYWLLAAFLLYASWRNARERRWTHAGFWCVLALLFAGGDAIVAARKAGDAVPAQLAGVGVVVLAMLAIRMHRQPIAEVPSAQRQASADRLGHWLFLPALLIPLLTVMVALLGAKVIVMGRQLVGDASATLVGLALASTIAAIAAILVTRSPALAAPSEGRRLLDTMGCSPPAVSGTRSHRSSPR